MNADLEAARRVKDQLRQRLAGDERLRGVGLVRVDDPVGSFAVVVRVAHIEHVAELGLPERVDGVTVQLLVVGDVTALVDDQAEAEATSSGDRPPVPAREDDETAG